MFKVIFALLLAFATASAQAAATGGCTDSGRGPVTTSHQVVVGGKTLAYSATVGFIEVTIDPAAFTYALNGPNATPPAPSANPPKGCIFFTYYTVANASAQPRPITFAFNGGPGSASLWLHLGALGPKRVDMGPEGLTPVIPFQLNDNADSPLDLTDIVMIDPMATGFSFPEGTTTPDQFFGAQNDAMSVATFIRDFLDRYNRRSSPLYVMGESYGGVRGSMVAQLLQAAFYLPLKGLILVSPWLSSTTTNFAEDDNVVPFVTFFPSYATTAWYQAKHGIPSKVSPQILAMNDPEQVFRAAKEFADTQYLNALIADGNLEESAYHEVAQSISGFTGISQEVIEDLDLRLRDTDFFNDVLQAQNETVGRFDARFVGHRLSHQDGTTASDPSDIATGLVFVSAINSYLRNDLNFQSQTPYADSGDITSWPFNSDGSELVATHNLSQALADNQKLRVFVASGYYDLACPMGTVEYERDHIDREANGRDRVEIHRYPAGHMMYINPLALRQLKTDLTGFFAE
jgi:carboxypeptidase C (cathepsin A)